MSQAPPVPPSHRDSDTVEFDRFVDARIQETRSAVKATDLATALAKLAAAALSLLLVATIVEHWLVPGGFGATERIGLFTVAVLGALVYTARTITPIATRRVNPLYAAAEIERDAPGLKNALVNLIQLRSTNRTPAGIRQTLERQAAERLAASPEATVDRASLVRVGYVLLTLVGAIGLYVVLSPKDLFATAARVAMPWADIAAPTRVRIEDLQPGATTVSQGTSIEISARVAGLADGETVRLYCSTRDRRDVDRQLPLTLNDSGLRYRALLPPDGGLGLQTAVRYRLAAGDARTPIYEIEVLAAPTISPIRVAYDYPDYTGYSDRVVEGAGDISAIEGTRVTLTAETNLPIDSAQVDLDADGRPDVRMQTDGATATGVFKMLREKDAGIAPRKSSYVLRFTAIDGQSNADPARYRYEVTPDLPPEATILKPESATIDVALGETVEVAIEARDPDFALSAVRLLGESRGRRVLSERLLVAPSGEGRRGNLARRALVAPARLGLADGDVLTYWVEAADNRTPTPNRVVTSRKRIRVVDDGRQQRGDGGQNGDQPRRPGDDSPQDGSNDGEGQPGDGGQAEDGEGSASDAGGQQRGDDSNGGEPENGPGAEQQQPNPAGERGEQSSSGEASEADPRDGESGDGQQQDGVRGAGDESENAEPSGAEGGAQGQARGENEGDRGDAADNAGGANNPSAGGKGERRPGRPSGGPNQPVARDGSDDGAAFDRIREHLAKRDASGQTKSNDRESDNSRGEPAESQDPNGDPSDGRAEIGDGQPGEADSDLQEHDAAGESPERSGAERDTDSGSRGRQHDSQSSDAGASGQEESSADSSETSQPREGAGDNGQNQAADEGAGQSSDQGAGERSGQAGDQQNANEPTGRPGGDERGAGSETRERDAASPESGDAGETSSGGESAGPNGSPADSAHSPPSNGHPQEDANRNESSSGSSDGAQNGARPGDDQPTEGKGSDTAGDAGSAPQGGVQEGVRTEEDGSLNDGEPGGDEANLEFARRQTELVLEKLSDQLEGDRVDRELLDQLGWTEDDLRRFIARWRDRQQRAERSGAGASELDAALRSLGIGKGGRKADGDFKRDELRDLKERPRTPVPPALRDRLRSFNRGVSASAEESGD